MKTGLLFMLSLMAALLSSCNFTENITINENGSGSMTMDLDGSQLMALAGEQMAKETDKRMDTIITFKEMFAAKKDSIAKLPKEEQERLKKMENFTLKMVVDAQTKEFNFKLLNDFKKIEDVTDLMESLNSANPLNKNKTAEKLPFDTDKYKTKTSYSYNSKKFKKEVSRAQETADADNDSINMFAAMFQGSTYTVNYKFPKKVKSVSNKNAQISSDKKQVTIAYPFTDYLDDPKSMSLEVEFEK
ncbi:hypothetical protein GR160_11745 [Flavobacterium sp. Sd200]|uniref:hypothetical protein n=1 Tax=Flavobacterium sp. Sd200 TaxID=2692211 RepID=UPI00136BAF48|nr:hypothetical protein [Flavobacterium sp. Sd200]MXN91896.1 hypothetical protein [Flavobacterium sp. Sd200]